MFEFTVFIGNLRNHCNSFPCKTEQHFLLPFINFHSSHFVPKNLISKFADSAGRGYFYHSIVERMWIHIYLLSRLLIALPQSMSSTLSLSIAKATQIPSVQRCPCRYMKASTNHLYQPLRLTHSDTCDLPKDLLRHYLSSEVIYKQHIVPSDNNLKNMRDIFANSSVRLFNPVILDRSPMESAQGFCRRQLHEEKGISKMMLHARYKALCNWVENWKYYAVSPVLRIHTNDLKHNFSDTVMKILNFWNVSLKKKPVTEYERFIEKESHLECVNTSLYSDTL